MAFESVYYETESGCRPVRDLVDGLNFKIQQKFFAREEKLLSAYAENLPPPHVHYLGDGIYEFKVSFANFEYRFLFIRKSQFIVFLHAFLKKTRRVPGREIHLAAARRKDFENRWKAGRIRI